MKIGILTFHNANNYGAVLHCFALQTYLANQGAECEVVDYRCPTIEQMHALRRISRTASLKRNIYNLLWNLVFFPRIRMFRAFRKQLPMSRKYDRDNIADANHAYDAFITGSDQVFNLRLTGSDTTYLLDFVHQDKRKLSYAASIGKFEPEYMQIFEKQLGQFDALSVRECSGAGVLEEKLSLKVSVVPDPVFLLTKEEWIRLFFLKRDKKCKPYLLIYALVETPELYKTANEIAKEKALQTVVITRALRPLGRTDKVLRNVSPRQFLSLIFGAEYIVTNSFHGTAFSILLEKQLSVCLPSVATSRIVDLLTALDMDKRIVADNCKHDATPHDYTETRGKVSAMRNVGQAYLSQKLFGISDILEEEK